MNARQLVLFVFLLSACPRKSEAPTTAPAPAPAATTPAVASITLPVLEGNCASDTDCAYSFTFIVDGKCCNGTCAPSAASRADVNNVERACSVLGYAEQNCPMKKCVAPPPLKCVEGHCAGVPK
ncbi:MAG: hypothetical protein JNM17_31650 [Archangium sp.]|nr:hypothetical protein [Archangium sp.]